MLVLGLAAILTLGTAAWAFYAATGSGSASAATGTLNAPSGVTASAPQNSSTVTVGWTGARLATGQSATGYHVLRIRNSDGAPFPACGTSPTSPATALTCSDASVPDGAYHYTVTALFGSWTAVSPPGNTVTVVNDSSLPRINVISISPTPNGNGYNNTSPARVNLAASGGTGIVSITYTVDSESPVTVVGATAAVSVSGDAIHTVTYYARDLAQRVSQTGSVFVRIDRIAPAAPAPPALAAASDSGSSSSDRITKVTTPTFTGTAEEGSSVTVYDGSTAVGAATATGGAYSIASSTLPAGTRTITATATDLAGNTSSASAATTITIDPTAPAAASAPALTAASDSGSSSTDQITKVTTPTFTGTAETGSTIALYDGSTAVGTTTATDGAYTVTSNALTNGTKTMIVKATDSAGNTGASSSSTSITIDVTAPGKPGQPSLTAASDTGRSSTDHVTRITTPTLTGTATAGTTVTLYDGAAALGSATATTGYMVTTSTLTSAAHTITAKAADVAGNVSPSSTARTITIDTTAPAALPAPTLSVASDTGKSSTDRVTMTTAPVVTGTNESEAIVTLYDGETQIGSKTTAGTTYSITSGTLLEGSHTLTATAMDAAGNTGTSSPGTTITIDTTAPSVTINQSAGQQDPATATPVNFTAVFSENVFGLTGSDVALTGTAGANTVTLTGSGTNYTVAVSGMTQSGTVIAKITAGAAQDAAGNAVTASSTTDSTVTYYDATAPVVAISTFAAGPSQTATLSGTAGYAPGDSTTVTVVLCTVKVFPCTAGNTKATLTPAVSPSAGSWTATADALGTNLTLYARATQADIAGNTGQSHVAGPVTIP